MSKRGARCIVVAPDQTSSSLEAIRWAARQSQLTGDEMLLVHAYLPGLPRESEKASTTP
jgi:hypothetical protein